MGTGLIFAAVVALWLAYFVPLALRRYDEATRAGSVDRFSNAMRVLRRPGGVEALGDARGPDEASAPGQAATYEEVTAPAERAESRPRVTHRSARIAAQRRRRTLLTLLAATVVVGALAAFAVLAVWSVAVPVSLVIAWLVACRVQARRERGPARRPRRQLTQRVRRRLARQERRRAQPRPEPPTPKDPVAEAPPTRQQPVAETAPVDDPFEGDDEDTVVLSGPVEAHDPHRKHVMERAPLDEEDLAEVEVDAVPVSSPTGATLWDPVPVTLPTYVTKPRAARTIRTIEFGEPGTWTSGRVEGEQLQMPSTPSPEDEHRHAVGD